MSDLVISKFRKVRSYHHTECPYLDQVSNKQHKAQSQIGISKGKMTLLWLCLCQVTKGYGGDHPELSGGVTTLTGDCKHTPPHSPPACTPLLSLEGDWFVT